MKLSSRTMNEKILKITEVENRDGKDGYEIETTQQTIFVGIDNSSQCCENWGYLSTVDDTVDFIGAELLNIMLVDTDLNVAESMPQACDFLDTMFVNFETSSGTFQLTCYNSHNGYYGHDVTVVSNQLSYTGEV